MIYKKTKKLSPCQEIRYREFPDLLVGKSDDGILYFDATNYILSKGDIKEHTITGFDLAFSFWKNAIVAAYSLSEDDIIIKEETSGHVLIEESLALLFVAYVDPEFGVHLLERMSEMLLNGVVLSDTALSEMILTRLTKEDIRQFIQENEKK